MEEYLQRVQSDRRFRYTANYHKPLSTTWGNPVCRIVRFIDSKSLAANQRLVLTERLADNWVHSTTLKSCQQNMPYDALILEDWIISVQGQPWVWDLGHALEHNLNVFIRPDEAISSLSLQLKAVRSLMEYVVSDYFPFSFVLGCYGCLNHLENFSRPDSLYIALANHFPYADKTRLQHQWTIRCPKFKRYTFHPIAQMI